MFKIVIPLFIIAETPIHAGGESALGIVDLPIQRERYTDFPKIEASAIKGCIRTAFEVSDKKVEVNNKEISIKDLVSLVFGPEEGELHSSAIAFTDARILLFPVKSLKGVFAWITCPTVLERFKRDMEMVNFEKEEMMEIFSNINSLENTIPKDSNIAVDSKVVLEEFTFKVEYNESTSKIASFLASIVFPEDALYNFWRERLKKDLIILSDDDFKYFVKNSTEIITRIRIDSETGTVKKGALWTEEYLPQDTIMYSLLMFSAPRVEKNENKEDKRSEGDKSEKNKYKDVLKDAEDVYAYFKKGLPKVIQIGGNQTIGKGFVRLNLLD